MPAFTHVLVATDLEETSPDVLDVAVAMAERFDAPLTVAHAFSFPPPTYGEWYYLNVDEIRSQAKAMLGSTVEKLRERYPKVEGIFAEGEPSELIPHLADVHHADLIVMGTHGRRGLSRVFLGSVAEKVVRFSHVPVLTVASRRLREKKGISERAVEEKPLPSNA